ncbi:MAG: LPS translocon maturation chaperone LptM [Steroidobacteraceae bacterium]
MKIVRLWLLLCLAGILTGCGQKGPLVQPDAPKHKRTTKPAAAPAQPAPGAPRGQDTGPDPAGTPATDATSKPSDKSPQP